MFRILTVIFRIAFIMFFGLIVIALFTNPGMDDFKEEVKKQLNSKVNEETGNPALDYIAQMGLDFTEQIVDKMVVRKNYFLCSVYTVSLPDGDYRYLGAFTLFYPLQEKNPLDILSSPASPI